MVDVAVRRITVTPCTISYMLTMCSHKCILNVYTNEVFMAGTRSESGTGRDVSINLRATRKQRSLIDQAAEALGKNRSDFMLEAACREAEGVLLDRRYFVLDAEDFAAFTAALDQPPVANPRLRRLLTEKAPWDR